MSNLLEQQASAPAAGGSKRKPSAAKAAAERRAAEEADPAKVGISLAAAQTLMPSSTEFCCRSHAPLLAPLPLLTHEARYL